MATVAWKKRNRERYLAARRRNYAEKKAHKCLYARQWYAKNRQKEIARSLRWNKANPEKAKKSCALYYQRHRKKLLEQYRRWRAANRPKVYEAELRIAIKRKGAVGDHTLKQWFNRFVFHEQRCFYCKKALMFAEATRDHMIPLSRGGTNWAANLIPACRRCNCRKGTKTIHEFLRQRVA